MSERPIVTEEEVQEFGLRGSSRPLDRVQVQPKKKKVKKPKEKKVKEPKKKKGVVKEKDPKKRAVSPVKVAVISLLATTLAVTSVGLGFGIADWKQNKDHISAQEKVEVVLPEDEKPGVENPGGNGTENPSGNGGTEQQPPVVEAPYTLSAEEQKDIAAKIYTGRRENVAHDPLSITLEDVKSADTGTSAYVSVNEDGKDVLYVLGYEGNVAGENISETQAKTTEKYIALGNYIQDETQKQAVTDAIAQVAGATDVTDAYVKVQTSDLASGFTVSLKYVLVNEEGVTAGAQIAEGREYEGLTQSELIFGVTGVQRTAPEAERTK